MHIIRTFFKHPGYCGSRYERRCIGNDIYTGPRRVKIDNVIPYQVTSLKYDKNFHYKLKEDFCDTYSHIGYVLLTYGLAGFFFQLIIGTLSDYIGKYPLIIIWSFLFLINQFIYFLVFINTL